jgi:hypothetical protein
MERFFLAANSWDFFSVVLLPMTVMPSKKEQDVKVRIETKIKAVFRFFIFVFGLVGFRLRMENF